MANRLADIFAAAQTCEFIVSQGRVRFDDAGQAGAVLRRAAQKCIEIIAEATKNLPDAYKNSYQDVPWRDIVDMRNLLSHAYDEIDDDLVWKVLENRIPELIQTLDLDTR